MTFSYRFVVVVALFITSLITANIIIAKQISVFGLVLPAAIIIFPLSYIIGDVLTEVYGYQQARRVIWLGFVCNLITVAAIWIAGRLPAAPVFEAQAAYERILGNTPRFLLASFLAYLAGEFANSFVLAKMKVKTKGQWLWARTIGSTLVGQGIDTVIVLTIGFVGVMPFSVLGVMILSHWLVKTAYEVLATPFTYLVVGYLKRKEGLDAYDRDIDFNPLRV
ncbi:MAG: queuosine precursor transporter [Chloroflexi bacterium]|nr:queuosine precursor transporter [Chloroflexota bacterium]MBM3155225.1 queuosine precursor transporter [Chloroflexota bacterium]MBM3172551.1 queuosine precursor transporter [Chloroflexota bacterium]MBM3175625.1 queuosine precursor transporter [Chloroflexota bacterium]MBM4450357.1 queuosine precursor transporter [Chloroflexota bacterium]